MPPKKNVAPSNAVRQFWCEICKKGYPRQPDYENHLRSYDHNHRQRLADMKKFTAQNDTDTKKRGPEDMRAVPLDTPAKKANPGPRFTKVTGDPGQSRFKKVGTSTKAPVEEDKTVTEEKVEPQEGDGGKSLEQMEKDLEDLAKQIAAKKAADEKAKEELPWVPYIHDKPSGCDHANCLGTKTLGIWDETDSCGRWTALLACELTGDQKAAEALREEEDVVANVAALSALLKRVARHAHGENME